MGEREQMLIYLLGYFCLQNARPDKAAILLAALDVLAPGQIRVLRGLALSEVRTGKPRRALDTLERLAMIGGGDAAFHLLRAQALGALERHEESAAAMQAYIHMRNQSAAPLPA